MVKRACTQRQQDLHPPMYLTIDRIARERERESWNLPGRTCVHYACGHASWGSERITIGSKDKVNVLAVIDNRTVRRSRARAGTNFEFYERPARFTGPRVSYRLTRRAKYTRHDTSVYHRVDIGACRFYDEEIAAFSRVSAIEARIDLRPVKRGISSCSRIVLDSVLIPG